MPRLAHFAFISCIPLIPILAQESKPMAPPIPKDVHGFEVRRGDGSALELGEYRGKVLLLVNTASRCGLTPQYAGLEALHQTYAPKGLAVLAFPANDFGKQEPGTDPEIAAFCKQKYAVTFPVFAKVAVKGPEQIPLYRYLTEQSPFPGEVQWNFQKYLVDRTGHVIARFDPRTPPDDPKLKAAIEAALQTPAPASRPTSQPPGAAAKTPRKQPD